MKLLGCLENKITKNKNGENVPHLEITEVVLFIAILLIMIINKIQESCTHLFQINCWQFIRNFSNKFLKTFNSEYDEIKVWFANQNGQLLKIEDRINLTVVIK